MAFGAASPVTPKFISSSDPAAQWTGAHKGHAFFAYSTNYLIDTDHGVILDVEATRAIRWAEVGASRTMIDRTEGRFGLKPRYLVADSAYVSAAIWLGSSNRRGSRRILRLRQIRPNRRDLSRADFVWDGEHDRYICPVDRN